MRFFGVAVDSGSTVRFGTLSPASTLRFDVRGRVTSDG